MVAVWRVRKVW